MTNESVKLKPCPFCGSKKVDFNVDMEMVPDAVRCRECWAIVRFSHVKINRNAKFGEAMDKLAEAWNRRKEA